LDLGYGYMFADEHAGRLYLSMNAERGRFGDNAGSVDVTVTATPP
jgi:hypothetical protein